MGSKRKNLIAEREEHIERKEQDRDMLSLRKNESALVQSKTTITKRLGTILAVVSLMAPYACSSEPEESGDEHNSDGGQGGKGPDDCTIYCENDPPEDPGDGDGDTMEPPEVDPTFINKGSLDYCTLNGIETKGDAGKSLLITDFESGSNEYKNDNGVWGIFWASTDGTGTSNISDGNIDWLTESPGRQGSQYAMRMTGEGFTEWGAGVNSTVAYDHDAQSNCLYDASEFTGISFWTRGEIDTDEKEMTFLAQIPAIVPTTSGGSCESGCWDSHKTTVTIEECWQQHVIPFEDLRQSGWGLPVDFAPEFLRAIEWTFLPGAKFDVYVDDVEFFTGEPPTPEQRDCTGIGAGGGGGAAGE